MTQLRTHRYFQRADLQTVLSLNSQHFPVLVSILPTTLLALHSVFATTSRPAPQSFTEALTALTTRTAPGHNLPVGGARDTASSRERRRRGADGPGLPRLHCRVSGRHGTARRRRRRRRSPAEAEFQLQPVPGPSDGESLDRLHTLS